MSDACYFLPKEEAQRDSISVEQDRQRCMLYGCSPEDRPVLSVQLTVRGIVGIF